MFDSIFVLSMVDVSNKRIVLSCDHNSFMCTRHSRMFLNVQAPASFESILTYIRNDGVGLGEYETGHANDESFFYCQSVTSANPTFAILNKDILNYHTINWLLDHNQVR